ncbi:MAG: histidine phosphatase family protein [Alphaproteobacteria bacterium]|nr:histidine phosphatase family protein [Alphaproteobacteria bacterium]
MRKMLYILRHAKAEIGTPQQDDHSRKLVDRGVEAARIVGAYMFRQHIKPDKVICSDAARTRETWEQIESIYPAPNVEITRKLYMASANQMLQSLVTLPEAVKSVLMIAHNPGVHQLCLKLAKEGDENTLDLMFLKFPTCTLAAIDLGDTPWNKVENASGKLIDFVTPKMLAGLEDD